MCYLNACGIQWYVAVLAALCGYAMGNISPATILGKIKNVDIRKEGSGNPGTTNVLRVLGKKYAVITLLVDILKGVVAVILGKLLFGDIVGMIAGLFAFIGHVFPVIFKFKGGKGVATALGIILTVSWQIGLAVLGIALLFMIITRTVSAGSVAGAIVFPVIIYFNHPELTVWAVLMALIVLVRHRENIKRLVSGTESKISFKK